jgi:ring-1,2-phenylacetyl-CoA epoxidase subunit PaaE
LIYGNRTTASVMFLDELADLKDRYPTRFRLVHVLSREARDVELFSGRVDAAKLDLLMQSLVPPDSVDDWFLCGPFAMVEDARMALLAAGVPASQVHVELFHVEGEAPRETTVAPEGEQLEGTTSVTVLVDGLSSTFDLLRGGGQRILDATLQVRQDAPYACKGGVCGTCRARLVEGEVAMERNWALEPDELAAGFVLACQSTPVSDRVVLDFDQ